MSEDEAIIFEKDNGVGEPRNYRPALDKDGMWGGSLKLTDTKVSFTGRQGRHLLFNPFSRYKNIQIPVMSIVSINEFEPNWRMDIGGIHIIHGKGEIKFRVSDPKKWITEIKELNDKLGESERKRRIRKLAEEYEKRDSSEMSDNIYVGVSPWSFSRSRDEFKELFEVPKENRPVKVMVDRMRGRSRGFGFIKSKTNSAMQFIINGSKNGETGVYVCVESSTKAFSTLQTYDFFDDSLVKEGKLHFFDLTIINDRLGVERPDGTYTAKDMEALLDAFEDIVDELGATRLVIDSITTFSHQLPDEVSIRHFIFRLSKRLRQFSCLLMMIPETIVDSNTRTYSYSIFAISEPEADEVYDMGNIVGQGDIFQNLKVVSHDSLTHLYLEKAKTHERLLEFDDAANIYKKLGMDDDTIRVRKLIGDDKVKHLDYDKAIEIYESIGDKEAAKSARKLRAEQGAVKVTQKVVHGDEVTKTEIKDSVVSKSNIGVGGDDKFTKLKELTEMKEKGLIDDDEFKQMKKEILKK